jgi:single-strand DNA-binding protein
MNNAQVTLNGVVTADPELKFAGETPKLEFSVACEYSWRDKAGEWQKETSFFNVIGWRDVANNASRSVKKGVAVTVTGRLVQRSWEDKETGQKRYAIETIADTIAVSTRHIGPDFQKFTPDSNGEGSTRRPAASSATKAPARHVPEEEAW